MMEIRDVFISCAHGDKSTADTLCRLLEAQGVSVYHPERDFQNSITNYEPLCAEAIRATSAFVILISENTEKSWAVLDELDSAVSAAMERGKTIIPVSLLAPGQEMAPALFYHLGRAQQIRVPTPTEENLMEAAGEIARILGKTSTKALLYERLAAYEKANLHDRTADTLCRLSWYLGRELEETDDPDSRKALYGELYRCLEQISRLYWPALGTVKRDIHEALQDVKTLLEQETILAEDLYFLAFAIRFVWLEKDIRQWAGVAESDEAYEERQLEWLKKWAAALETQNIDPSLLQKHQENPEETDEATAFWLDIAPFFLHPEKFQAELQKQTAKKDSGSFMGGLIGAAAGGLVGSILFPFAPVLSLAATTGGFLFGRQNKKEEKPTPTPISPAEETAAKDERLQAVASFMREGNRVLDLIGEDENAADFLRCLLTSYQRLQSYCEIIGEKEICGECIDRVTELQMKLDRMPPQDHVKPTTAATGIRSLLGFSRPDSGTYDVFISYHSPDRDIAESMYAFFRQNMLEPFYDRKVLPELAESEYSRAINRALDNASHFVVIFSDLSYIDEYAADGKKNWVFTEMYKFYHEMEEGRKKNGNFLLVVTGEVYDRIIASNKKCIPIEFRDYEIMKVTEYKDRILRYIRK